MTIEGNEKKNTDRVTYLKPEDFDAFLEALEKPPAPTEAMKDLMRKHKERSAFIQKKTPRKGASSL